MSLAKNDNDVLRVVNATSLAFVGQHEILFRIGEYGRSFYVCLSGTAQMFAPSSKREKLRGTIRDMKAKIEGLRAEEKFV